MSKNTKISIGISLLIIYFFSCSVLKAQDKSKDFDPASVLNSFVGKWSGNATAYYPRDSTKKTRYETIEAIGRKILKDTYVEMQSTWTQENGESRELFILWNYHIKKDSFQILFLYDNWPGRVDYPLSYDPISRTLKGYDTFIARGGISAEEKVEWQISEDGKEIRGTEYNHLATDPEDYWPKTFEYILRRED